MERLSEQSPGQSLGVSYCTSDSQPPPPFLFKASRKKYKGGSSFGIFCMSFARVIGYIQEDKVEEAKRVIQATAMVMAKALYIWLPSGSLGDEVAIFCFGN
jgi:hypothetical protein